MANSPRRRLLLGLGAPLFAACAGTQPAPPRADAPPSPSPSSQRADGRSEPAPMPSDATDAYLAQRRASRTAAPTGPDAMPSFEPAQRIGTDIMLAPIPAPLPR